MLLPLPPTLFSPNLNRFSIFIQGAASLQISDCACLPNRQGLGIEKPQIRHSKCVPFHLLMSVWVETGQENSYDILISIVKR
jgi:hypothetical protein